MRVDDMKRELVTLGGGAHALAIQILGNRDDAADAVHDSIAKVLERPTAYQPKKGPLKTWFMRVVRNRCVDLLRGRRLTTEHVDELPGHSRSPDQHLEAEQCRSAIERALSGIPAEQREILILRDYVDLSYADIAIVLDVANGTVMSRLHRARTQLSKVYRQQNGSD